MQWAKNKQGFTIVELLIVIAVIAILAAIAIVSYTGIQSRARDTKRLDDVSKIVEAFQLWGADTGGTFTTMSAGSGGAEIGWFDNPYPPSVSIKSVLVSGGYLSDGVVDPINSKVNGPAFAYMVARCDDSDQSTRVVLARLETKPSETMNQQLGRNCTSSNLSSYVSFYAMNYGRLVEL